MNEESGGDQGETPRSPRVAARVCVLCHAHVPQGSIAFPVLWTEGPGYQCAPCHLRHHPRRLEVARARVRSGRLSEWPGAPHDRNRWVPPEVDGPWSWDREGDEEGDQ